MKKSKGCVYFFKHINLTPVKIGYSTDKSPIGRFEQFKTYAPFGAELLGFIETEYAKKVETELHEKYLSKRLCGEWFEVSIEEVANIIKFYTDLETAKDRQDFWIEYSRKIDKNSKVSIDYEFCILNTFDDVGEIEFKTTESIFQLLENKYNSNLSKQTLTESMKSLNFKYGRLRTNGSNKRGFWVAIKPN